MPKNRSQIAAELGISVTTLWRKLKAAGLELPKGPVFPRDEARIKQFLGELPEPEASTTSPSPSHPSSGLQPDTR